MICLYVLGFYWPVFLWIAHGIGILFMLLSAIELFLLYQIKQALQIDRILEEKWSMTDNHEVRLVLRNLTNRSLAYELIDELPIELQERQLSIQGIVGPFSEKTHAYTVKAKTRGIYTFENVNVLVMGPIQLFKRQFSSELKQEVKVYPRFKQIQSKKFWSQSEQTHSLGMRKQKHIGLSYEFEQIKPYIKGDDIRHINWKASAKNMQWMSNQYAEERSQNVYAIIDKSRAMNAVVNEMILLDFAINASIALGQLALKKKDQFGVICYSDKIGAVLKAGRRPDQFKRIMDLLIDQSIRASETNIENLFLALNKVVKTRSLIFLFTNMNSKAALQRQLPIIQKIKHLHQLVVVFYDDTDQIEFLSEDLDDVELYYRQVLLEESKQNKLAMLNTLKAMGIQTVLSQANEMSVNTMNKYLEIKARGML